MQDQSTNMQYFVSDSDLLCSSQKRDKAYTVVYPRFCITFSKITVVCEVVNVKISLQIYIKRLRFTFIYVSYFYRLTRSLLFMQLKSVFVIFRMLEF